MKTERMGDATIHTGDVLEVLRTMPDESVHTVVTSPPYWGLRDYGIPPTVWDGDPECVHDWDEIGRKGGGSHTGIDGLFGRGERSQEQHQSVTRASVGAFCRLCGAWRGCYGLEPTPELYVQHSVQIFREVRRVLRKDGTLWLNLGSSYASGDRSIYRSGVSDNKGHLIQNDMPRPANPPGFKPKDMIPIPWMVAMALQSDGWYLRSACPWIKRNPIPECVTDRPSNAIEYMFLLSKSKRYFWDAEAIKSTASKATNLRISQNLAEQIGSFRANGGNKTNGPMKAVMAGTTRKIAEPGSGIASNRSFEATLSMPVNKRNRRNSDWFMESWQGLLCDEDGDPLAFIVNPKGYKEAHFATFPGRLVQPCILAGCPEHACPKCGAPWVKEVEREFITSSDKRNGDGKKGMVESNGWGDFPRGNTSTTVKGEHATCTCGMAPIGGTVLDPFGGSGTTAEVALEYGRRAIIIELKPEYVELAKKRLKHVAGRPMLDFCGLKEKP